MVTSSPEFPKKSLQIKQQDHGKLFSSRMVSKENSMANPSFRVYYGGVTGAIPFTWEIQPGTPKHNFSDSSLPPLTPPPSYYHHDKPPCTTKKNSSRSKLFNTFFFKISLKKSSACHVSSPHSVPPSSSSQSFSSSWLSSLSSSSSRTSSAGSRRRFLSFGSSFDHDGMDDGHVYVGSSSPTSVYCFGSRRLMIRI